MNAQQRTLDDLKIGVNVQIDKSGHIRYRQQPQMGLPSREIIDKAVVTQLEAELQDTRIDKANAERHRDNTFAENAALKRENEALREYLEAHMAVEGGLASFELHKDAVTRLEKARDALLTAEEEEDEL